MVFFFLYIHTFVSFSQKWIRSSITNPKGVPRKINYTPKQVKHTHVKMSETRDFSGLKDSEGWSQVRNNRRPTMQKSNVQRQTYRPAHFDVEQERRARTDAQKNAEQDRLRQAELSEVNFPSLASAFGAAPKPSAWTKSGTQLATAWKQADEEHTAQIQAEQYARQQAEERDRRDRENFLRIPRRTHMSYTHEDTYYEDEEEPPANGGAGYAPPPQDDWERVQKKAKIRHTKNSMEQDEDEPPTVWDEDHDETPSDFDWSARPGRRNNDSLY